MDYLLRHKELDGFKLTDSQRSYINKSSAREIDQVIDALTKDNSTDTTTGRYE